MMDLLDRLGTPRAGVHEDVLEALRVMRAELVEGLYGRIVREDLEGGLEDEVIVGEYVGLVKVWDGLICLGRCVGGGFFFRDFSFQKLTFFLWQVMLPLDL